MSEDLGSGAILDMIAIPGGSFVMGSPTITELQRDNNENYQHTVNISPFFMGKYEVTQEQWQVVMENNPSNFQGAKRPVEQVSWNDAVEFCQKLSQKTGKSYRLPSEAEWEYACRAGTKTPFHFGETITPDLVNYNGCPYGSAQWGLGREQTTDVGSFPPNAFGLYDMHGNVCEWCSDRWNNNYRGAPTNGSSWETGYDEFRVRRGGSWNCKAAHCRSAYRSGYRAGNHDSKIGFRVALVSV
jgi:formylglycine-generating enzyme required for sulfatase activity